MSDLLLCRNLTKYLGDRLLFKGIDYSIKKGQRIGLIGPNGVGKSTFLKTLAGLVDYDSGEIVTTKNLKWTDLRLMVLLHIEQSLFLLTRTVH